MSDKIKLQTYKLIHFKFSEGFVFNQDGLHPFWFAIWTRPFKYSNILITISWPIQDIAIKMFDHFKGRDRSYGESKWVTKPSENLKWINFYVCNVILSENWI